MWKINGTGLRPLSLFIFLVLFSSAVEASMYAWLFGTGPGTKNFWDYGTGPASLYYWKYERGPGSSEYWNGGKGPGSRYFWETGRGPGSKYYWSNGKRLGSLYYWLNGRGPGSLYFWKFGNGKSFDSTLISLCMSQSINIGPCKAMQNAFIPTDSSQLTPEIQCEDDL